MGVYPGVVSGPKDCVGLVSGQIAAPLKASSVVDNFLRVSLQG